MQTGPDINPLGTVLSGGSSYRPGGSIPPHAARWVRLTWIPDNCATGVSVIDFVSLEVRVG